ncbi:MAG: dihydrofolate reductase family protein [Clostridia bacterium]|nr:dihydrofolate reductase family protein [Clostridia bacterium]
MKTVIFSQISIDGKLTLGAGHSSKDLFSLFSVEDMEYIHKFRGSMDGIMVGRKTIEIDNPFLTNRFEEDKNPIRIIPTTTLNIPIDSNIFNDEKKTIIVTTENCANNEKMDAIRKMEKDCIICGKDTVDFKELFKQLENRYSVESIMVEGGGQLNWNLIKDGLVDEIILMQLPLIIGGASNITLVDGEGYTELQGTRKFELQEIHPRQNYALMRYSKV